MKAKLLIGLTVAGLLLASLGASVMPASADPHQFVLTLVDGRQVPWTGEPGAAPAEIVVDGVAVQVIEVQDQGPVPPEPPPTEAPPAEAPPAEAPPAETPPAETPPAETPPAAEAPAAEPAAPPAEAVAPPAPAPAATTPPAAGDDDAEATKAPARKARSGAERRRVAASKRKRAKERESEEADKAERRKRTAPAATATAPAQAGALAPVAPAAALSALGVPNLFIDAFRIPPFLLPIYQAAGMQYGIRWEILAAVNEIETDYGRNLNVSTAGAVGWMQFLPSTWASYGVDANGDRRKDPYNPVDAIFAAARYLAAAGAERDIRAALWAYNHADWYVESVLMRARLIAGLPAGVVDSLTGLTHGHFPVRARATRYAERVSARTAGRRAARGTNPARTVESRASRRGIDIFARSGAPVIAVQDGRIVDIGIHRRLGRFIQVRDVYGNTYTYGHLRTLARWYPVPKQGGAARPAGALPAARRDPKPTAPASAGRQRSGATARAAAAADLAKHRLFANPTRPNAFRHGGEEQLVNSGAAIPALATFRSFFGEVYGLGPEDVVFRRLRVGSRVLAGTVLGRIGRGADGGAAHVRFEIRPPGRGAPRIDPKPILDGWRLLESTSIYRAEASSAFLGGRDPSLGQLLLMSKDELRRRVLANPDVETYGCGRRDIGAGIVDRRVLATLELLAASGLRPTVTSLRCGHSFLTASGNVSEHSSGTAVDIAAINGTPIAGHQGPGSIADRTIRRLLQLQGTMKPHQIISLMSYDGADNTLSLPDHDDHIHVGFRPLNGDSAQLGRQFGALLGRRDWDRLIDRLGELDNPTVLTRPSRYSIKVRAR